MSSHVTSRALGTVATTIALAVGLSPAASAQDAEPWNPPFSPGHGYQLPDSLVVTLGQPGAFWDVGDRFRLLSPHGQSRPVHCQNDRGHPYGRCWQVEPDGRFVELRQSTGVSDVWHSLFTQTGSTASASIGLYELARRMGWMTTSGGIFVPPLTSGSAVGTYSNTMPLSPHAPRSPVFDVWVHPGFVPGS
ncbi:hypothetical protein [Rhodococcus sp. IEGM 1408]|uniref:hypothetical protein n=1 Tax=Rhodococcus sp. IEGM 1408 TaxID=3082220 RepID=UPI0029536A2B|nr:hypothetical protein [Rhodococcus sp. IEGM 1408]MDV8001035.1 hypothetical protein [Rhodococcus sp. IEGM 1408]